MHWAESQEIFILVWAFTFMTPGKSFLLGVWDLTHIDCTSPFQCLCAYTDTHTREELENHKSDVTAVFLPCGKTEQGQESLYYCHPLTNDKSHETVWPRERIMKFNNLLRFKCLHYFYQIYFYLMCVLYVCMYVWVYPPCLVWEGHRLTLGNFLCHL